jgi:hypothetical protein
MKKAFIFTLIGFIASTLLTLSYLTFLTDFLLRKPTNWADILRTFIPIYNLCILVSLRHILVKLNDFQNFNVMFNLFILLSIIGFFVVWIMRFGMNQSMIFKVIMLVIAIFSTVWYLWFFVSLSKIHNDELKALTYIQIYGILFLICFLLRILLPQILKQDYYSDKIPFDSIELIPYVFLIIFFYKHLLKSTNRTIN